MSILASNNTQTQAGLAEGPFVLIVDDEESIRETLAQVLEDETFQTLTACDGPSALAVVREMHPAVVFLDIWMPGWDGLETLERIKQLSPATEVVMISGHSTIANALEAKKRGAFDFIEKPLDIETIISSASRAVDHWKRQMVSTGEAVKDRLFKVITSEQTVLPSLTHPGIVSTGIKGDNVAQRTLRKSAILYGQGLHSGQKSGLILEPLPLNSGVHFGQIGSSKTVPAFIDYVESTSFATTIRRNGWAASTIEHLMSALHAYRISNLLIKCNGEVPILDGSAKEFCQLIEEVGIEEQGGEWWEVKPDCVLTIGNEHEMGTVVGESITIEPSDVFSISYELNYPAPVGHQEFNYTISSVEDFKAQVAPARTFGFLKDIEQLQKAGLAAGGRLDNFILIGRDKIVNTELRFADELVRHKILDVIGDLFLLGRPLVAKVTARMTGHSDNVSVLRKLRTLACGE